MKNIQLTILFALTLGLAVGISSCKKDLPPKGSNECCQYKGKVTRYIPGCIITGHEPLVITDGFDNWFVVEEDLTGQFQFMKEGDIICFDYELLSDCPPTTYLPKSGIRFIPTACIKLTCIKKRNEDVHCDCDNNSCSQTKQITYKQYQSKRFTPYTIHSGQIINDKLMLKISFGGCKDEDVELQICEAPTMGPFPQYFAVIEYPKTTCEMLITKEVCFDISKYPKTSVFSIKDRDKTYSFKR